MDLCSGDKQKVQCPRLPRTSAQQTAVKEYSQVEKCAVEQGTQGCPQPWKMHLSSLVFAHCALNTWLGYLNKAFRKDKKIKKKTYDSQQFIEKVLEVWHIESAYKSGPYHFYDKLQSTACMVI